MKKFLSSSITLIAEIIILVLAGIWWYSSKEIEPIVVGVAAFTAILVGLFFRSQDNTTSSPSATEPPSSVDTAKKGDSFAAEEMEAAKDIDVKLKQKDGKASLKKIKSKKGGIKFDIDQT